MTAFTECVVEKAALAWLASTGWTVVNGADIAPGESAAECDDYGHVVLIQRLQDALARLNSERLADVLDDAFHKLRMELEMLSLKAKGPNVSAEASCRPGIPSPKFLTANYGGLQLEEARTRRLDICCEERGFSFKSRLSKTMAGTGKSLLFKNLSI